MNLVPYAVPFFIVAMLLELVYGVLRRRNPYRLNDSVSSLFLGTLSQARRFVTLGVGYIVYDYITAHFALWQMDPGHWFTWVFGMVAYDFCYYWLHRLGHERTILWAAHVAHHQSEDYNLTTALRQTSTGFLLGWIFYIPMYLLGVPAEVVITVGSLNLIYQFWVHTEHVPKLGWYEWLFVTPSNHRVHHAQNDRYVDRNYGGLFILWDRMFGTFQEERADEPCIYGIRGPLHSWNPLRALTHIYVDMALDSWRARDWRDKLKVWVARTGWRPADVAARFPRSKTDLAQFRKYDPEVTRAVSVYAFCQLVAAVALLNYMQFAELDYAIGVVLVVLMVLTMVTTAWWLEGRDPGRVMRWELFRLGLLCALLPAIWLAGFPTAFGVTLTACTALNLLALPLLLRSSRRQAVVALNATA
jgi:sterol desaturase/sphingolipid hydroxylase (fatty acid hydroxylase superfamily)